MNSSGHPFGPGPVATISEKSPRAKAWRTIFGGLTAPIKTAVPQRCEIARLVSLVYWLDIGRIDSETMDRLVAHAQAQSAGVVPHEQVRLVLVAEGMPIHYDDVSTITDEHPETIVAGIEAEIAKATADVRNSVGHSDIRDKLDMRQTLEIDRLMDPLRRKAEEDAKHGSAGNEFYETPQDIRHAALDAMFADIGERTDAQAGFAPTSKVQTVDKPYSQPRLILTIAGAPPNSTLAALIGQHIGSHTYSPMMVNTPNGPEPIKHDPERTRADVLRIRDAGLRAIQDDFSLSNESDISSELSSGDGLPPALCSCLTDDTLHGPHCVHSRAWLFRQDDGVLRVRKHGGAPTCPRACVECAEGAHHFCEIDMQPVFPLDVSDDGLDEDEREEIAALRKHPAHVAGCESWYECRHCDAWLEASDNDTDLDEDEDEDSPDSDAPDSDAFDDDDDDWCNGCDNPSDECDCDDEPDSAPGSSRLGPAFASVLAEHPTNDGHTNQEDVRPVSVPAWAAKLARDILFTARFLNWVSVRVPNNVAVQWSAVIASWPNDVQASVHAWLGPQAPGREQGPTQENAPAAVRALVDQANGGES